MSGALRGAVAGAGAAGAVWDRAASERARSNRVIPARRLARRFSAQPTPAPRAAATAATTITRRATKPKESDTSDGPGDGGWTGAPERNMNVDNTPPPAAPNTNRASTATNRPAPLEAAIG